MYKHSLTRSEAVCFISEHDKDPEQGIEYLHGLEDEGGNYRMEDIQRFINR